MSSQQHKATIPDSGWTIESISARPLSAAQDRRDLWPPAAYPSVPADGKRSAA